MRKSVHLNETNLYELVGSILENLDLGISSSTRKRMNENIVRGVKDGIMKYVKEATEDGDDDEIKRYRQELLGTTIYWETEDEYPFYIEIPVLRDIWRWNSNDMYNGRICLCGSNGQCIAIPRAECDSLLANGYISPENGEILVLVRGNDDFSIEKGKKLMNHLLLLKGRKGLIHDNHQREGNLIGFPFFIF